MTPYEEELELLDSDEAEDEPDAGCAGSRRASEPR